MSTLRKLNIRRAMTGVWEGVSRGLSSSNEVFDAVTQRGLFGSYSGLELDAEAIRSDVGRATAKVTREIAKSIRPPKAG